MLNYPKKIATENSTSAFATKNCPKKGNKDSGWFHRLCRRLYSEINVFRLLISSSNYATPHRNIDHMQIWPNSFIDCREIEQPARVLHHRRLLLALHIGLIFRIGLMRIVGQCEPAKIKPFTWVYKYSQSVCLTCKIKLTTMWTLTYNM